MARMKKVIKASFIALITMLSTLTITTQMIPTVQVSEGEETGLFNVILEDFTTIWYDGDQTLSTMKNNPTDIELIKASYTDGVERNIDRAIVTLEKYPFHFTINVYDKYVDDEGFPFDDADGYFYLNKTAIDSYFQNSKDSVASKDVYYQTVTYQGKKWYRIYVEKLNPESHNIYVKEYNDPKYKEAWFSKGSIDTIQLQSNPMFIEVTEKSYNRVIVKFSHPISNTGQPVAFNKSYLDSLGITEPVFEWGEKKPWQPIDYEETETHYILNPIHFSYISVHMPTSGEAFEPTYTGIVSGGELYQPSGTSYYSEQQTTFTPWDPDDYGGTYQSGPAWQLFKIDSPMVINGFWLYMYQEWYEMPDYSIRYNWYGPGTVTFYRSTAAAAETELLGEWTSSYSGSNAATYESNMGWTGLGEMWRDVGADWGYANRFEFIGHDKKVFLEPGYYKIKITQGRWYGSTGNPYTRADSSVASWDFAFRVRTVQTFANVTRRYNTTSGLETDTLNITSYAMSGNPMYLKIPVSSNAETILDVQDNANPVTDITQVENLSLLEINTYYFDRGNKYVYVGIANVTLGQDIEYEVSCYWYGGYIYPHDGGLLNPVTGAKWWNDDWMYRKKLPYVLSSTFVDNCVGDPYVSGPYRKKITVYRENGTDAPGEVYLSGHCSANFSDVRFIQNINGIPTKCDYFIAYRDAERIDVWIEFQLANMVDGTNDNGLYIYYGITRQQYMGHETYGTTVVRPDGAGDLTQLSKTSGLANWECVDEEVADGTTTSVYTSDRTNWKYDDYTLSAVNSTIYDNDPTIYSVTITGNFNGGSYVYIDLRYITHGTRYSLYGVSGHWHSGGWSLESWTMTVNSYTGEPWTWDEVNAMQAGIGMKQISSGGVSYCTQVYVTVNYSAGIEYEPIFDESDGEATFDYFNDGSSTTGFTHASYHGTSSLYYDSWYRTDWSMVSRAIFAWNMTMWNKNDPDSYNDRPRIDVGMMNYLHLSQNYYGLDATYGWAAPYFSNSAYLTYGGAGGLNVQCQKNVGNATYALGTVRAYNSRYGYPSTNTVNYDSNVTYVTEFESMQEVKITNAFQARTKQNTYYQSNNTLFSTKSDTSGGSAAGSRTDALSEYTGFAFSTYVEDIDLTSAGFGTSNGKLYLYVQYRYGFLRLDFDWIALDKHFRNSSNDPQWLTSESEEYGPIEAFDVERVQGVTSEQDSFVYNSTKSITDAVVRVGVSDRTSSVIDAKDECASMATSGTLRPNSFGNATNLTRGTINSITLRPEGAGYLTGLSKTGGTYNWQCVDEAISDGNTSYVYAINSQDLSDYYNVTNHTSENGQIVYIKVYEVTRKTNSAPSWNASTYVRVGTTNYLVGGRQGTSITTAYTSFVRTMFNNPATSSAWNWSAIDDLQVGLRLRYISGGSTYAAWSTQVYVEVYYVDPANPSLNWQQVEEEYTDAFTSTVSGVNTGGYKYDLYNIEGGAECGLNETSEIYNLTIYALVNPLTSGASFRTEMMIDGSIYHGSTVTPSASTWTLISTSYDGTNPKTSLPWTFEEINDLQIGIGISNSNTYIDADCTMVYVTIEAINYFTSEYLDEALLYEELINGSFYLDTLRGYVFLRVGNIPYSEYGGRNMNITINITYGGTFLIRPPTYLDHGSPFVAVGLILDPNEDPISGMVGYTYIYYDNGDPVPNFIPASAWNCTNGNFFCQFSTDELPAGRYYWQIQFRDPATGMVFKKPGIVDIAYTPGTGGGDQPYVDAYIYYTFYDIATGTGLDDNYYKVYISDTYPFVVGDRVKGGKIGVLKTTNKHITTGEDYFIQVKDFNNNIITIGEYDTSLMAIYDGGDYGGFNVTRAEFYIDMGVYLNQFRVKNMNDKTVYLTVTRTDGSPGQVVGRFVPPYEEMEVFLPDGWYNLTIDYYDNYNMSFLNREYPWGGGVEITTDTFYWIEGYSLADIIISIWNTNTTIMDQLVNVGVYINNDGAEIINQTINMAAYVANLQSNITQQTVELMAAINNTQSNITLQVNSVWMAVNNSNSNINNQSNLIKQMIVNTDGNITTQINAVLQAINNTNVSILNQFNMIQQNIQNMEMNLTNQTNLIQQLVENTNTSITNQLTGVYQHITNVNTNITTQANLIRQEINNTEANITMQLNAVSQQINNTNASIQTQMNLMTQDINNANATIHTQLNGVQQQITNFHSNITSQVNSVYVGITNNQTQIKNQLSIINANITNVNSSINTQVNGVSVKITNMETNITNQTNLITAQITNMNTSLSSQINSVLITIQNNHSEVMTQLNAILAKIENQNTSIVDQINLIWAGINNTNSTVVTQVNGIHASITTFRSEINNSFSIIQSNISMVNTTIVNLINSTNASMMARMLGILDNVSEAGVSVFDKTVEILHNISLININLTQEFFDAVDNISHMESNITNSFNDVFTRIGNVSTALDTYMTNVMNAMAALNITTNLTAAYDLLNEILYNFQTPHEWKIPNVQYTYNDTTPPISTMHASLRVNGSIEATWHSVDDSPQTVAYVDVYYKIGTGAWKLWESAEPDTGSLYFTSDIESLDNGSVYWFRALATDSKGNAENVTQLNTCNITYITGMTYTPADAQAMVQDILVNPLFLVGLAIIICIIAIVAYLERRRRNIRTRQEAYVPEEEVYYEDENLPYSEERRMR